MSATNSQSDKFLYLFRTDVSHDFTKVKDAFHGFYNYSAGANNTFEATGCANFKSSFKAMLEKVDGNTPSGLVPVGGTPMNTLVIVIMGYADATGLADTASAAQADHIKWSDLRDYISGTVGPSVYPYCLKTEVHVICITPFCNSLKSAWNGNTPVSNGTLLIPQTVNDIISPVAGPAFLNSWVSHLKLETSVPLGSDGRISFNAIANVIHGTNVSNFFISIGIGESGNFFPGYNKLEIQDGNPNLWESTDISIEHPNDPAYGAGYETGYLKDNAASIRNHIKVKVLNSGTHPLKKFRLNLGLYLQSSPIPGSPAVSKFVDSGFVKAEETVELEFTNLSFQSPNYANLVAVATYSGDAVFTDVDISTNKNEAQRSIALINESLDFTITKSDVTPIGGSNGSITVTGSGGVRPYVCSCTGKADQTANPSCTFGGLNAGVKTITLKDSSSVQLTCSKQVTLNEYDPADPSDPADPGFPVCDPRLDTQYLSICRLTDGSLRITFKAYPLQPVFSQFRFYKIHWKVTGLNSHKPASPPTNILLRNAVITASGIETIAGITYTYHILRVPYNQTGRMTLVHQQPTWPFGHIRLEVVTEIFYRKYYKILQFIPLLRIARFKLLVTNTGMDIINIP